MKTVAKLLAGYFVFWAATAFLLTNPAQLCGEEEEFGTAFRPAPRSLRQHLVRAGQAVEERRFGDAVVELGVLLAEEEVGDALEADVQQDFFYGSINTEVVSLSLKGEAQRLLGSLPESARELYELQFGADAKELLDLAAATGSISQLTEVTRKYFHTQAGHEATLLLGRLQLDRGHPLAAAMCLQRLVDAPSAAWKSEPELSLLSAACWARAGSPVKAREILKGLRTRFPDIALQTGGQRASDVAPGADIELWLTTQLAGRRNPGSQASKNWLMFRGDAARNAGSSGDVPLPSFRWRIPTASDPTDETLIEEIRVDKVEQGVAALPSVHPLAVGEVVLMRTPERLLAIDFETGKRVWEYPWWSASYDDVSLTNRSSTGGDELTARREKRFQRLWQDAPYGQVSSDGNSVYMLDELRYVMPMGGAFRAGINGGRFPNPDSPESHNQLVALDLRRQGSLRWMVGGETGLDEPKLAGAFFLGAPLPLTGHLYAMAEIGGEIRLVVLDSATGKQEWSQQLAQVVDSPIDRNGLRRLAGATPSYSDGVLICPTSAGAVLAVDIATRSLMWGYQYKQAPKVNNFGVFNRGFGMRPDISDRRWVDASVTISDGAALVAPVDEDKFICLDLDLKTQEPRWELARDEDLANALYIGCVHEGRALVICKHKLVSLKMENGDPAWEKPIDLMRGDSEMPSGRGFRSGDYYFLPTTTSSLVKISLTEGKIIDRTVTPSPLGNLICYKDEIVTHSAGSVAAYFQIASLRGRVATRLQENADDSWALARQGELFLHDGKSAEALRVLRRAHELDPDDDAVRSLLVSTFLTAIKLDFAAHRELAEQVRPLIDLPSQLADFWRLTAEGFHESGEFDRAVDAYLALADVASKTTTGPEISEPMLIDQDSTWSVRSDRWIQARLAQLFESDDEAIRQKLNTYIANRATSSNERTLAELQNDLDHFGFHSACDPIRLDLADRLIEASRLVEAEQLLSPLRDYQDRSMAGAAIARMALVYRRGGESVAATRSYQELGDHFASIPCLGDVTGADLLAEAQADPALRDEFGPPRRWPWGAAEIEERQGRSSSEILSRLVTLPVQTDARTTSEGVTFGFDRSFSAIVARDRSGRKLMEVSVDRVQENGLDQTRLMGSLGIVYFGAELIGVDMLAKTLGRNEPVRWRLPATSRTTDLSVGRAIPIPFDPLPHPLPRNLDDDGRAVSSLGPVTRQGVIYQRNRTLNCVDPLTGRLAWSRSSVEQGATISGDEELVLVADRKEGKDQASIYRTTDGKFLAHRPLPAKANTWAMIGRFVLAWDTNDRRLRLHLRDIWEQRDVWQEDVSEYAKATLTNDGMLALLDTNGRFVIHSLTSDRVLVRARLEPDANLNSLRVIPSGDDYILFANTNRTQSASTARTVRHANAFNAPVATGRMYMIDRNTGQFRWQVPAFIDEHGFVLQQPSNSPALWFVRNVSTPQSVLAPNNVRQASVLCIDRRDGRVLYVKEDIATQVNEFNVFSNTSGTTSTISLPGRSITVTFTDAPTPPTPPAQTGTASSLASSGSSLANAAGSLLDSLKEGSAAEVQDSPFDDESPKK
ncbi:MAG: PQQ-binding-like beta-propeller repeat protein [Planctomycetes bacterium]|nr:PQQ-binding-like beta-propeller repeat protein [Planctomycetota bacterium]